MKMRRWLDISKDPNSKEAMQARSNMLVAARAKAPISNRINYLCSIASGKDILDIGVVDHTIQDAHRSDWLHGNLYRCAKTCLGIDILEEEVEQLRHEGFNVVCIDISKEFLEKTFDLIICGDVIEHLDTPGNLLANAVKMLRPSGKIVLSVPNPWYINVILQNVFNGTPYLDNADHVSWFDPCTICELGQRYGLALSYFVGVNQIISSKALTKLFFSLAPLLISLGLRPELFCKTIIYEFVLADESEKAFASN
jgi:SAM-dependent methyltransferase